MGRRRIFALGLLLAAPLIAQEEAPAPTPPREMRILPVGDHPPFRQEIRGGVRYELPAPPWSIPPRQVEVVAAAEKPALVRLTLGRPSEPVAVPAGPGSVSLREKSTSGPGPQWLRVRKPEAGDFLVVLWRDPSASSWKSARALVLPSDAPAGSLTILNIAPGPVALIYRGEKIVLRPNRPLRKALPARGPAGLQLATFRKDGSPEPRLSISLEQQSDERTCLVLYRSDGHDPRTPVGYTIFRERAPVPSAPAPPS
ncbi:MAG: hypothetical protein HKN82_12525 [Akkermansiaceae bacterium]|nr:hypothetical protein [Akkermansiaceae bacterium]